MVTQSLKSEIQIGFKDISRKIRQLASESQNEHTILETEDGYRVLNRYEIRATEHDTWVVVHDFRTIEPVFNRIANALFFCMAEYAGDSQLARDLERADNHYYSKQFDIQNKIHLLKSRTMDPEVREIMMMKLDEDMKLSRRLKAQLQKLANSAKYIKTKGSHYEFTGFNTEAN